MSNFQEASIHELDDYIASYYEDDIDIKINTAKKILVLTLEMKNMEHIVTNEEIFEQISLLHRNISKDNHGMI